MPPRALDAGLPGLSSLVYMSGPGLCGGGGIYLAERREWVLLTNQVWVGAW